MKKLLLFLAIVNLAACSSKQPVMPAYYPPVNNISAQSNSSDSNKLDFKISNVKNIRISGTTLMLNVSVKYDVAYGDEAPQSRDLSFRYDLKNKKAVKGYIYLNGHVDFRYQDLLSKEAEYIMNLPVKLN